MDCQAVAQRLSLTSVPREAAAGYLHRCRPRNLSPQQCFRQLGIVVLELADLAFELQLVLLHSDVPLDGKGWLGVDVVYLS